MRTERALDQYLLRRCTRNNIYCRKLVAVGQVGFPDRVVIMIGNIIWIELKSPTGKGHLSPKQVAEHKRMRSYGLDVRVIWTKEQVDALVFEMMDGLVV